MIIQPTQRPSQESEMSQDQARSSNPGPDSLGGSTVNCINFQWTMSRLHSTVTWWSSLQTSKLASIWKPKTTFQQEADVVWKLFKSFPAVWYSEEPPLCLWDSRDAIKGPKHLGPAGIESRNQGTLRAMNPSKCQAIPAAWLPRASILLSLWLWKYPYYTATWYSDLHLYCFHSKAPKLFR
jgi:hypothetical protein